MQRTMIIATLVACVLLAQAGWAEAQSASPRPNIIVVLTDDQGWGDLSVHGNTDLSTPNIDSLARDGALFERFFVSPVCSPTRAEFLTGRYHPRGGVRGVSTGQERLDLDERTIAEIFHSAGYATGAFGKWHNGMQSPYHPNDRGFEEYYGFCSGHWGSYFDPELDHNGQLVRGEGYITDDFTNHAMQFIEQHREGPFFCYVAYNTPHSPMQVPDRFFEKFAVTKIELRHHEHPNGDIEHTRAALAMCENIDWNIGRLLGKLDELQLAENTMVVYFSDNGPNGWRWNGGMKGRKGSTDEGGIRVPMLVRWPGRIPAGTRVQAIATAIDLLPTLSDLAGVELPNDRPLDGITLKPLLLGEDVAWEDRPIFSHWNGRVSVRTQRYRLDHQGRLYDMQADPGQEHDITARRPEVAEQLAGELQRWKQDVLSQLGKEDRPFTVGYSETTPLPARDRVPPGGVQRSGRAPNCSFFTNWTTTDDAMTWDIEVAEAGPYQAVIYYTCPADDVGSTVELSMDDNRLEAKIDQPHDPPLYGIERDRVDRGGESYVKDFKPLELGVIDLPKGRGTIKLRALEVPGDQVAEVRYLMLTKESQ